MNASENYAPAENGGIDPFNPSAKGSEINAPTSKGRDSPWKSDSRAANVREAAKAAAQDSSTTLYMHGTGSDLGFNAEELQNYRDGDLKMREFEIALRESQLKAQEEQLKQQGVPLKNNFPPLFPLMYHNIEEEVPVEHHNTVRLFFRDYQLLVLQVLVNFVATFVILMQGPVRVPAQLWSFLSASVDLFICPFFGLVLWYRPVYNAYMKNRSLYYYAFFVFYVCHILFQSWKLIGFPGSGSAGIIVLVGCLASHALASTIFVAASSILWGFGLFVSLALFYRVKQQSKLQGHTYAEAKSEASSYGVSNAILGVLGRRKEADVRPVNPMPFY